MDAAGAAFAAAVAEIEIDAIILLLSHGIGGGRGTPVRGGRPPAGLVLGRSGGAAVLVPVAVETITPALVAGLRGGSMAMVGRPRRPPVSREFEPPLRDHTGPVSGEHKLGGRIPETDAARKRAVDSWTREELEFVADELEQSIAARNREQGTMGETSVGDQGQRVGAGHRDRIRNEEALLRAVRKKLGGS
ncbi:hypothetical protein AB0J55_20520 [Amycolatopsis sp. NPDC049688]|uniref:hypothetical protein n=1 Tax=Amycolatopsis sp. NPDC049688 TaxID=3154733 RepID=UPI0034468D61